MPKYKPDESFSVIEKSFVKSAYNRDDMPIRTSTFNYEEEQDVIQILPEKQKTVNFLKKGGGKMSWKSSLEEKTAERLEKSYIQLQKSYISDEESPNDSKPKDFLKRKSKKIVPQKINWKVEKKIDCWLSRDSAYYSKDSDFDIKPKPNILHLEELEKIFLEMSGLHLNIHEFLDNLPNEKVPQLCSSSKFVIEFNEDKYQEMIEKLEGHYNNLCSDEVISK